MTTSWRSWSAGGLVAALAVAAIAPAAMGAGGGCTPGTDWGTPRQDLAPGVVEVVNAYRTSIGIPALEISPTLTAAAEWKARHMAHLDYVTHPDPGPPVARSAAQRVEACGYPSGFGENLAAYQPTPEMALQEWLTSPGHKATLERDIWAATGVGVAAGADGRLYWAQEFGTFADDAPPRTILLGTSDRDAAPQDAGGPRARCTARQAGTATCTLALDDLRGPARLRARLLRGLKTYATGTARSARGGEKVTIRLRLRGSHRLRPGRYTLSVRINSRLSPLRLETSSVRLD